MNDTARTIPLDETAAAVARELRQVLPEPSANTIFGAPLKLATQTVIPVAMIEVGGGLGGGFGQGAAGDATKGLLRRTAKKLGAKGGGGGGGGGLTVRVRPVGYLCEENGHVVFRPIQVP